MKKKYEPRIGNCYGSKIYPDVRGVTWIEGEMWNTDYGQFRRNGLVRYSDTQELVKVKLDVPDTYFSIPATTDKEHGFVMLTEANEFKFCPHVEQKLSPAEFRKSVRKARK